jgi:hypothetical protein
MTELKMDKWYKVVEGFCLRAWLHVEMYGKDTLQLCRYDREERQPTQ